MPAVTADDGLKPWIVRQAVEILDRHGRIIRCRQQRRRHGQARQPRAGHRVPLEVGLCAGEPGVPGGQVVRARAHRFRGRHLQVAEQLLDLGQVVLTLGAAGDGFAIGEFSDAVCTSFITQKNLGTFGDSGGIITNRDDIVDRIRALRNHGSIKRSYHSMGYNSRLDDLHAGILSVKLKKIDDWSDRRREVAAMFTAGLKDTGLKLPYEKPGYRHVYHLYVIRVPQRDALQAYLHEQGIGAAIHYPVPIHLQPFYADDGFREGQFPVTEQVCDEILSLPMFPEMTEEQVRYVANQVIEFGTGHPG